MPDTMTAKERVLGAINLQKTDRVPCTVGVMMYFVARHNKIKIADFLANPVLQFELTHKMFEELGGFDLVSLMPTTTGSFRPENTLYFMPLKRLTPGKDLPADSIPQILETELMPPEDYDIVIKHGWLKYIKDHIIPQVGLPGRGGLPRLPDDAKYEPDWDQRFYEDRGAFTFAEYYEAMVLSPFEILSAARSMEKFLIDLYRRPEQVIAAMDTIIDETIKMILSQYDSQDKKPSLWLWGGRSSSGFISPKQFEKFAFPYYQKIFQAVTSRDALIKLHFDQDWTKFLPYFREFPEGTYMLLLDGTTDIFKAKEIIGDRMCIQGDVPATLFKLGTPQEVETYCKKLIDIVGRGGGFILSSGCDVPHDAKFENLKAMIDTAKNYQPSR